MHTGKLYAGTKTEIRDMLIQGSHKGHQPPAAYERHRTDSPSQSTEGASLVDTLSPDVWPPEPGDNTLCYLSCPVEQATTAGVYRCPEYDVQAQKWGPGATCSQGGV